MDKVAKGIPHFCNSKFPIIAKGHCRHHTQIISLYLRDLIEYKEDWRMLTMTQVKDIRKMYFEEGKNISEIAKKTGHDRKTVRGYLDKDNWNEEPPKVKKKAAFPKLDPYKQEIDT
jgi:hypothetical protein